MENIEQINSLVVHKPNQLIELIGTPISNKGLLTYNYLLHLFQKESTNQMVVSPKSLFKVLEISDKYDDLYEYLNSLISIKVVSRDKKGKLWGAFNLLNEFRQLDQGIYVSIPMTIFNTLCGKDDKELYYTTIKLLEEKSYKCSYSIIFHEIFKKYENIKTPCFSLEELRKITGTIDKYPQFRDFKRYVLVKALEEINSLNQFFEYGFTERKIGRKVSHIQFTRKEKNIKPMASSEIVFSEKLKDAIKKVKRNVYVSNVYSDKAVRGALVKFDEDLVITALNDIYNYNKEIKSFSSFLTGKLIDLENSKTSKLDSTEEKIIKTTPTLKPKALSEKFDPDKLPPYIIDLKKKFKESLQKRGELTPELEEKLNNICSEQQVVDFINKYQL